MSIDDYAGVRAAGGEPAVAQARRPRRPSQLTGHPARRLRPVPLSPGEQARVTFRLHADRTGDGDASQITERRYWWASIRVLRGCVRRRAGRSSGSVPHRAAPSATGAKLPRLVSRQSVAVPSQRGWAPVRTACSGLDLEQQSTPIALGEGLRKVTRQDLGLQRRVHRPGRGLDRLSALLASSIRHSRRSARWRMHEGQLVELQARGGTWRPLAPSLIEGPGGVRQQMLYENRDRTAASGRGRSRAATPRSRPAPPPRDRARLAA